MIKKKKPFRSGIDSTFEIRSRIEKKKKNHTKRNIYNTTQYAMNVNDEPAREKNAPPNCTVVLSDLSK